MIVKPEAIELLSTKKEEQATNGWEKLLPLLDPAIVNLPRYKNSWKSLDKNSVFYLTHTMVKFPWLNHFALAGVILESEARLAHPTNPITQVHSLLLWAIPTHYPDVTALKPAEALIAFFGDPPRHRGVTACASYTSIQLHVHHYLTSLSDEERAKLLPFVFPTLIVTPQLTKLRSYVEGKSRAKRKEQTFAVVRDFHALIVMGRRRYKWLVDLDVQVQQVSELVKQGEVALPVVIQCKDFDNQHELTFRVWDRRSWMEIHKKGYADKTLRIKSRVESELFLQLVGDLPDSPWFLRAAEVGVMGRRLQDSKTKKYLQDRNLPTSFFQSTSSGLLNSSYSLGFILRRARRATAGTPEDSRVLFSVEPLLTGAVVGLFALVCLTQSGMRVGELLQVTGDKDCMKIGLFPQFNEINGHDPNATKMLFWQLFPKGSTERQSYPVSPAMQEALKVFGELHRRFCGDFKEVSPSNRFSHSRRFKGKHKFVLQWNGKQLRRITVENCLDFLLLDHMCLDQNGRPVRITAHILRHGVAGYLRNQGVPLEEIAGLLKQVNIIITAYYSKLSPQDLHMKLGPFLTRLGDIAEIDPATIRTVGDIQILGREALKRYGILRHTPGGTCSVFTPCEVQFKCAGCQYYIPDPTRRGEVREKISSCSKTIRFLEESGDCLQADVQKAHRRNWERVELEINALDDIKLTTPPFESVLKEFGIDNLDEVDDEWLLILKGQPKFLSSGDKDEHS